MIEIICALVAGISTIICAAITTANMKKVKITGAKLEQRTKETRLMLEMIRANSKLTMGTALAIKNNHANGELEDGLKAVEIAEKEYQKFIEEVAIKHLNK